MPLTDQAARRAWPILAIGALLLVGCGPRPKAVRIDGSSTVYPISEAVFEEFSKANPGSRITVGLSGTGGGFQKFIAGEIDICNASRPIRETEIAACEEAEVEYVELSVAFDGIAVVVNPQNDWCDRLTVDQLASIWRPGDHAISWADIDPAWPDKPIKLYGPGTDSGTFDYFTKAVVGKEKSCRPDFTASEDDNVLVTGVSKDKFALGYFGFAYYTENAKSLKLVGIKPPAPEAATEDAGSDEGYIVPTVKTIRTNSYRPLSRPLFIYVRKDSLLWPDGKEFVDFYLANAGALAGEVGYVAVSDEVAEQNQAAITDLVGAE